MAEPSIRLWNHFCSTNIFKVDFSVLYLQEPRSGVYLTLSPLKTRKGRLYFSSSLLRMSQITEAKSIRETGRKVGAWMAVTSISFIPSLLLSLKAVISGKDRICHLWINCSCSEPLCSNPHPLRLVKHKKICCWILKMSFAMSIHYNFSHRRSMYSHDQSNMVLLSHVLTCY